MDMDRYTWTDGNGTRNITAPNRVFQIVRFGDDEIEVDMGVPSERDKEIFRLAKRLEEAEAETKRVEMREWELRKALAAIVDAHFASASTACGQAIGDAAALLKGDG